MQAPWLFGLPLVLFVFKMALGVLLSPHFKALPR